MNDPIYPPTLARRLSAMLCQDDMLHLIAQGHGYRDFFAVIDLALQVTASESYNSGLDAALSLARETEGEALLCGIEASKNPEVWSPPLN
jgi:hypothetical protein